MLKLKAWLFSLMTICHLQSLHILFATVSWLSSIAPRILQIGAPSAKHGSVQLAHVRAQAQLPADMQCARCTKLTILNTGHTRKEVSLHVASIQNYQLCAVWALYVSSNELCNIQQAGVTWCNLRVSSCSCAAQSAS